LHLEKVIPQEPVFSVCEEYGIIEKSIISDERFAKIVPERKVMFRQSRLGGTKLK